MLSCQWPERHSFGVVTPCNDHVIRGMQPAHQGQTIGCARSQTPPNFGWMESFHQGQVPAGGPVDSSHAIRIEHQVKTAEFKRSCDPKRIG